jgi:hypothetical protein
VKSAVKHRHLRLYALAIAVGALVHARRGRDIDAAAASSEVALSEVLAARGLVADPADTMWTVGPSGLRGAFLGGARALVRAGQRGEPADLYLVAARLSPEGALLDVGTLWNLTRSTDADESRPVRGGRGGHLVAYTSVVDGLVTAVHVLDLQGGRAMPDLNRLQKMQQGLTELQNTGQTSGVSHDTYVLDSAATHVTLAFEGGDEPRLLVDADGHRLVIDPAGQTVVTGADSLKVTAEERARPGGVVTWAVDRVRAMPWFGDDNMQTLKAVAFTGLDYVLRTRERLIGDEGAKEVAADLAGVNAGGGGGTQETFNDPDIGWPPPPMEPVLKTPLPNEGRWIELDKDPFITRNPGVPAAFATSFLRPDKTRPQSRMYITMWDPRQIALHMVAGTVEPVSATGAAGPGLVPRTPEVLKHLVGGFNGGFQAIHGEYGMEADGVVYLPPKPYAATVLELADGTTGFGSWPASTEIPADVLSFRQNMTAIVQNDRFNPWGRVWWGGTPPGWADNIHTTRSGICLTKENFVGYFYGLDMSAEALAIGMLHARCAYGIHLDMNGGLVNFELYDVEPKEVFQPLGRPLQTDWEFEGPVNKDFPDLMVRARRMIRTMGQPSLFPQYLHRGARDFFYLTTRAELPGAELAVGPSPKEPGEGSWRVKGLPQHGFPYAVAIAQTRPDAAQPQVKVRALRIDPRAVRLEPGPVTDLDPRTSATVATFRAPPPHPGQTTLWLVDNAFALTAGDAAPQPGSVALVSGWTRESLPRNEQPRAAVGIHDEDGMLEWIELAPQVPADSSTTALLDATLAKSGCSARVLVPPTAVAMLGDDLDLTMTTMPAVSAAPPRSAARDAAAAPAVATVTVALQRRETPGARDYFPQTPIVSPNVWQPLQSQRVRYFPKKKKIDTDGGAGSSVPADNPEKKP